MVKMVNLMSYVFYHNLKSLKNVLRTLKWQQQSMTPSAGPCGSAEGHSPPKAAHLAMSCTTCCVQPAGLPVWPRLPCPWCPGGEEPPPPLPLVFTTAGCTQSWPVPVKIHGGCWWTVLGAKRSKVGSDGVPRTSHGLGVGLGDCPSWAPNPP